MIAKPIFFMDEGTFCLWIVRVREAARHSFEPSARGGIPKRHGLASWRIPSGIPRRRRSSGNRSAALDCNRCDGCPSDPRRGGDLTRVFHRDQRICAVRWCRPARSRQRATCPNRQGVRQAWLSEAQFRATSVLHSADQLRSGATWLCCMDHPRHTLCSDPAAFRRYGRTSGVQAQACGSGQQWRWRLPWRGGVPSVSAAHPRSLV